MGANLFLCEECERFGPLVTVIYEDLEKYPGQEISARFCSAECEIRWRASLIGFGLRVLHEPEWPS